MDDAPALVFVPPTPLNFDAPSPSPVRSSTSFPPQPRYSAVPQRASSETAIFSIYSMYGDDPPRSSWSASPPVVVNGSRKSLDASIVPAVKIKLPDNPRQSTHRPNGSADSDTGLAYYDDHDVPPPTREHQPTKVAPRPSSSYAPSSLRTSVLLSEGHTYRTSGTSSHISRSRESTHDPSNHSRHSSSPRCSPVPHARTESSDRDLLLLPPLPPSIPPSRYGTPTPTPPRQPSPAPNTPQPNATPKTLPLKHPVFTGSPASKVSLVPSEGEDMDAFHVRNTYAQLEASGVKGDGYEEGVERTRARVGPSRTSQLNADAALGDGSEKSRELDPKEIETLASVDRYGFFALPSHDRLILLASDPLLKRLAPVPPGPPSAPPHATALRALPPVTTPPKEMSRISKWTRMLTPLARDTGANVATWGVRASKEGKLRARVYKGIPDAWRSAAWELLMSRYARTGIREMELLGREYRDALDKPSTYDIQIDLDVPRTISGHIMFRTRYGAGQRSLFHVLHCFSLRCAKCGYVQGMGPIAATLLCYFDPERVYASLVRLHDAYSMHTVFSPGFPGLLEAIYVQERVTEQMMPGVFLAFKKHMISTTSYATKWYITLFSNSVPFQTQLRLWDAFLMEGYDVFIAVAVAIVWVYRDQITSSGATFETVLSLLSSFFVPEDEDTLLAWIGRMLGDKKLRTSMLRWKEDWRGLVASGKDGTALL
ncbi:putative protein with domain in Tre-2, BUB2p, and Cdc16p [Lyophyllum shimeji]|uniref:Rab-GAP TBC domain-containing protein n=1 Tax=Lyophyllum shimeji TaxID=47721 RepID=A0A9P3PYJ1_LYOSH|nr:putative protein with domain in Tre-2, BUB2p, and Cdc16p [Lyophyllum shimeji]